MLEQKLCKQCNAKIKYSYNYFRKDYCSKTCASLATNSSETQKQKCKDTLIAKYGVDNIFKSKDTIKIIQEKRNVKNL